MALSVSSCALGAPFSSSPHQVTLRLETPSDTLVWISSSLEGIRLCGAQKTRQQSGQTWVFVHKGTSTKGWFLSLFPPPPPPSPSAVSTTSVWTTWSGTSSCGGRWTRMASCPLDWWPVSTEFRLSPPTSTSSWRWAFIKEAKRALIF